jgi:hypothetical protein
VRVLLISKGAFTDMDVSVEAIEELDKESIDRSVIEDLQQSLNNVNLKRCEEIINELIKHNYGQEINASVKKMKEAYDMFDYHTVKDMVSSILDVLDEGDN